MARRGGQPRLRIALVAPLWIRVPPLTYGGIERRVFYLCEAFKSYGHEVTLFATGDSETPAELISGYPCGLAEAMDKGEAYVYEYYGNACIAEALHRAGDFDILHFHLGAAAIPFSVTVKTPVLHTIPTALTCDDHWILERCPRASVTALSKRQIADLPTPIRKRIHVVYNGCDFNRYRLARGKKEYLVFMGRMAAHKGPAEAIEIARKTGLPIHLAGAPIHGVEQAYFNEKIKPLIDGDSVIYHGEVTDDEKSELLDGAAALLFPIKWDEPFGNVMIESMACGVPVLACQRGSVPEVVETGKTGFFANHPDQLVELVARAAELDRSQVRETARRRFSYHEMAGAYLSIYNSLTSGQGDPP